MVVLSSQNLRRDVVWSASLRLQDLVWCKFTSQPEVDQFQGALLDGFLRCENEVFGLEVSVRVVRLVHVVNCPEHVLHQQRSLFLVQVAIFNDPIKQLTTSAQLKHQIDVAMILERLIELADVGVIQDLHDLNLLPECFRALQGCLVDRFDCPKGFGGLVSCFANRAIRALANLLFVNVIELGDLALVVNDQAGRRKTCC
mmetsp:Transcript_31058/g.58235  ORF Transcript_31058/g.58235 Transcript_31058/m.58235 type:complete len:200 (-) Transcript_31058:128-727(-)